MERKTENDTRPVMDDLTPEMFADTWELLQILETENIPVSEESSDYSRDTSTWDM